jgi:hypothetical protein
VCYKAIDNEVKRTLKEDMRIQALKILVDFKERILKTHDPYKNKELLEEMECVLEKSCLMFDEESIYNYSGKLIKILNKGRYLNNSGVTLYEDDEVPHREHPFSEVKGSMKSRFYTDEEMLHVANAKEYVKSRLVIQDDIDIINQINPM